MEGFLKKYLKKLSWVSQVLIVCGVINILLAIYRYFNYK